MPEQSTARMTLGDMTSSLVKLEISAVPSYKPSRFSVHTALDNGGLVVYNSQTGRHCTIPERHVPSTKHYLSKAGHRGSLDAVGDYLFAKGYIVKESLDEKAAWDLRYGNSHHRADHLELMLLASEDCNFRCVYCSQQFKRGSMLPHVRRGVISFLEHKIRRLNSLNIAWFGGEPLVGWDAIEELAPKISAYTEKHDVLLSSSMTTNAYLLWQDRARQLLKWGVRHYQITLDGTAQEHDAHRPLKDGGTTFDVILSNLIGLRALDEPFSVALRVNADKSNSQEMNPLFEQLAHHFGNDDRFQMRFKPIGQWGGANDDQLNVFCDRTEQRQVLVQLRTQAQESGMHVEAPSLELQPHQVCYASRPYALIAGADGKIMKCSVVLDTMPANVVGRIHEDGSLSIDDELLLAWIKPFYKSDSECQKCFFLPSCEGASCPLPRFADQRPCPSVKLQIQQTLRDLYGFEESASALIHSRGNTPNPNQGENSHVV